MNGPANPTAAPAWTPLPGPQTAALASDADVVGYGGAAGGGKSDLLLGLAGTQHHRSVIFRREFDSARGLIERSREIYNAGGAAASADSFNENLHRWRLASGRVVEFGGCKSLGDEQKWRGRPHDFIGFDEADQFLEFQVRFLLGWKRTTRKGQRCRAVLTFNPPATADGRWLLTYFGPWLDDQHPHPALPGELRWYATLDNGDEVERPDGTPFLDNGKLIQPQSRTFIPARIEDNPYLLDTGYKSTLQALPEPLRSQLLYGDFKAGLQDDPWQVIPTAWVQAAQARWTSTPPHLDDGPQPQTAIGVDVARGGQDRTVLAPRHGVWFAPLVCYPGSSTPNGPIVAKHVLDLHQGAAQVNVDVIGVGGSVVDHLDGRVPVAAVNVGAASTAHDKSGRLGFSNLRAQLYWQFREALDPETGDGIALPPDAELAADLTAPRYSVTTRGIQVESKEALRERLKRSPDKGDAVLLARYSPPLDGFLALAAAHAAKKVQA